MDPGAFEVYATFFGGGQTECFTGKSTIANMSIMPSFCFYGLNTATQNTTIQGRAGFKDSDCGVITSQRGGSFDGCRLIFSSCDVRRLITL